MKKVKTVCDFCGHAGCSLVINIDGNRVEKTEGDPKDPNTDGLVCPQGLAVGDIIHAKDRLTLPLIRTKENEWRKASWDEALTIISSKLTEITEKFGSESIGFVRGYMRPYFVQLQPYHSKLASLIGTPNYTGMGHVCARPRSMGASYVFGRIDPWESADTKNSNCIVLWGINPIHNPPKMKTLNHALNFGKKLIVIDPRATPYAKKADLHLQLRPGTDGALALSIMNVIIEGELYDKEFTNKWTIGFEQLKNLVQNYPPSKVSKITWVDEEKISEAAITFATLKPASIDLGNGLDQHTNNFQTIRAIASLIALTGNVDVRGGNIFPPQEYRSKVEKDQRLPDAIGSQQFSLTRGAHLPSVWKAILEGQPYKIRGMMIIGANPSLTDPDTQIVCKALKELEFLVVVDVFMTATAKYADIILPAAYFLESDLYSKGKKVIDPPGEAWPDHKIIMELGKKMGYETEFQKILSTSINNESSVDYQKYLKNGFPTPSGKVEFYSQQLEDLGYSALPNFIEPVESPLNSELSSNYPLILTTGAKLNMYTHSQFRNIPFLRKLHPDNCFMINPNTARKYGVEDGAKAVVESPTGRLAGRVKTTLDLLENVIQIYHGFEEMNANILTSSKYFDPHTGSPGLKSSLCRIFLDE